MNRNFLRLVYEMAKKAGEYELAMSCLNYIRIKCSKERDIEFVQRQVVEIADLRLGVLDGRDNKGRGDATTKDMIEDGSLESRLLEEILEKVMS